MKNVTAWLRRDGWLLAVLALCIALCAAASRTTDADTDETRIARVLSGMEGAGTVEVALFYTDSTADHRTPCRAVIVADGAGDVAVQLRLVRAVTTLLGVDASAVEVFKRDRK